LRVGELRRPRELVSVENVREGGLFVTHTNADTERTLRRARAILHEREGGFGKGSRSCPMRKRHVEDMVATDG